MKTDMLETTTSVRLSESTRVEAFSDAVMAIVITILVLELRVPEHEPGRLLPALLSMWGPVLAFLISFLRVSVIWLNHHGLFVRIRRVDRTLLGLNLGILLACTIIPLPTALLADALRSGDMGDLRVAAFLNAAIAGCNRPCGSRSCRTFGITQNWSSKVRTRRCSMRSASVRGS